MIKALFEYTFVQNAFIAAILSSIVCGIIGTIIVEKKLVMLSGGVAHASFGGIGLGYFLKLKYLINIEPIFGGLLFAILSAIGLVTIDRKTNTNSDTIMGMFWSVGMALGILFISLSPGYPPDMTSYLFGDILTVSTVDIKLMFILDLIIIIIITSLFSYWKAYLFDEEFTKVLGISTLKLEYFLFILISFSIVVLIKVVGIILVIALLTVPPAIAKLFTYNLKNMMILSILVGCIFCVLGLYISYSYDIQSGATIILLSSVGYIVGTLISKISKKVSKN